MISDPREFPDEVVCFNVTTLRATSDRACILTTDDHPWIRHDSCIYYARPRLLNGHALEALATSNKVKMYPPLRHDVFARILDGALSSITLPDEFATTMFSQGLLRL